VRDKADDVSDPRSQGQNHDMVHSASVEAVAGPTPIATYSAWTLSFSGGAVASYC
jgi:hypothetical protein